MGSKNEKQPVGLTKNPCDEEDLMVIFFLFFCVRGEGFVVLRVWHSRVCGRVSVGGANVCVVWASVCVWHVCR